MATSPQLPEAFRQGLRDLGYVEGRNVVIEYRDAGGNFERLPALAAELVALKVDVILAGGTPHALAAKHATRTIPIVFAGATGPVENGLVTSLARPGGNLTGLSVLPQEELVGKRLELIKQAVPGISQVAILRQPGAYGEGTDREIRRGAEVAARALGVRVQFVEARGPADFDRAFSEMTRAHAGALILITSSMFFAERRRLVALADNDPADFLLLPNPLQSARQCASRTSVFPVTFGYPLTFAERRARSCTSRHQPRFPTQPDTTCRLRWSQLTMSASAQAIFGLILLTRR
jgi:ABC transporter substrate binding protein